MRICLALSGRDKEGNFRCDKDFYLGFEVLTAVVVKCTIFWDITPCNLLCVNRSFGRTSTCFHSAFLLNLFFRP
jgi:hypothetical protein